MRFRHIRALVLVVIMGSALGLVSPVFAAYRGYSVLLADFMALANSYPSLVTYENIGKTVLNKDIVMFKVGNPAGGRVLLDGTMHGHEDMGSELLLQYARWLLTSGDPLANSIVSGTYTLIIPAVNIDRYGAARKNTNGVDLNRNFATNWASGGSTSPTSEYYRGPAPLSEPESQTLVRVFQTWKPAFYINLHRGGEILYTSTSGNSTYYSLLHSKMTQLASQRQVASYSYQSISGAGQALTDAARAGITSFNLELIDFQTITLQEIQTRILPKFIPVAAALSLESESPPASQPWDLNQDGEVNIFDTVIVSSAYMSTPDSPNWNPVADIDSNGIVNIYDLVQVNTHYGEEYTSHTYTLQMPFDQNNPTTAMDYSGYNNHGEITGSTWTSQGINGGAYTFDGNDVITIHDAPSLDGGGNWSEITVDFWTKPTALLRGARIVAKKAASASTGSYMIGYQTSTSDQPNTLFFGVTVGGSWQEVVLSGKPLAVGVWHHVVCTYESGHGLTIYINGTQAANQPLAGTINCGTGDEPLFLGYDGGGTANRYYVGIIDEVRISPTLAKEEPPTYSTLFGFSSYPRTAAGTYSFSVIDQIIGAMSSNQLNIYRMSFAPSVDPNPYVQYYLDNCDYDLIVDLWHLYPPGTMTDTQWIQVQNDVLAFCSDFANYQDRVWIEPVNERENTDLASHIQTILSAVRAGGYSYNVIVNKMGQSWDQMASISDPLDRFWTGLHFYFDFWDVSDAKSQMTTALSLGLKILNTEVGADADEYGEFTQAKVDELNEFLTWCAQRDIGNTVWTRYGLGNYPTYKTYGLVNPLTEQPMT